MDVAIRMRKPALKQALLFIALGLSLALRCAPAIAAKNVLVLYSRSLKSTHG